MLEKTHIFIVEQALDLTKGKFDKYREDIKKGCIKEDHPRFGADGDFFQLTGTSHFYHPVKKTGYFRFSSNAKQRGLTFFDTAVHLYKKEKYKRAFYFLGKSLHLLADAAIPAHTKLEFHLVDVFEDHMERIIPNFEFKLKKRLIPKIRPQRCFDRLAKISYNVKYKKKHLSDFLHLLGFDVDRVRHKKLHKIANKLLSESILYSYILLKNFEKRIKKPSKLRKKARSFSKKLRKS